MTALPTWMRRALLATGIMNVLVAFSFLPAASSLRALAGLPEGSHPLYLLTCGLFILLFGLGYLWTAVAGQSEPLFMTLAALGKLSFFTLVTALYVAGEVSILTPLAGSADLFFGGLFAYWLFTAPWGAKR